MKVTTITSLLATTFFTFTAAQSQCDSVASAIPTCGQSCILSAGSAIGCSSNDYACQCTSSSDLQASALNCVVDDCGLATALEVVASASAVCSCIATATPTADTLKERAVPGMGVRGRGAWATAKPE